MKPLIDAEYDEIRNAYSYKQEKRLKNYIDMHDRRPTLKPYRCWACEGDGIDPRADKIMFYKIIADTELFFNPYRWICPACEGGGIMWR